MYNGSSIKCTHFMFSSVFRQTYAPRYNHHSDQDMEHCLYHPKVPLCLCVVSVPSSSSSHHWSDFYHSRLVLLCSCWWELGSFWGWWKCSMSRFGWWLYMGVFICQNSLNKGKGGEEQVAGSFFFIPHPTPTPPHSAHPDIWGLDQESGAVEKCE